MSLRPPVPYFGSKQRVADWIVDLMPDHGHYVEPYAGGLSVLLAKPPSRMETVNDLDGELVCFWRILRDRPQDLVRAVELTPHARAELTAAWEPTTDEVELARRVWIRLTQGRGGMMRRTGWRLAAALHACTAAVVLSGYDSRLYAELYADWHRYELITSTGNATGDKTRTEVLWSTRPLGSNTLFALGDS